MSDVRRFTVVSFIWLTLWCAPSTQGGPFDPWKELEGHKGMIYSVAFSPDGKLLASGGEDHKIRLWDVKTGKQLFILDEEDAEIGQLAFLSDNRTLIVNSNLPRILHPGGKIENPNGPHGRLSWWDLKTKQVIRRMNFPSLFVMDLSTDGKLLVTTSGDAHDKHVKLMDAATGKETAKLLHTMYPGLLVISPNRKWLAISFKRQRDSLVQIWDLKTLKPVASVPIVALTNFIFTPNSKLLVCGQTSIKPGITLFDIASRKIKGKLSGIWPNDFGLACTPDGKRFLVARDGNVDVHNAKTGKRIVTLRFHLGRILAMALSRDGSVLATTAVDDKTIALWRLDKLLKQE